MREPLKIHFGGQANLFDSGLCQEKGALASAKAHFPSLPEYKNILLDAQKQLLELPFINRYQGKQMRKFHLLLLLVLFVAGPANASGDIKEQGSDVIIHSLSLGIKDICAWPNLTQMPDGSVIATIFNQPSHGQREGTIECWRTCDEGKTWNYFSTPIQNDPNNNRMNVAAGLTQTGDFLIIVSGWLKRKGGGLTDNDWRAAVLNPAVCRSSDGGKTWSVSENFPDSGKSTPFIPFGDIIRDDNSLAMSAYVVDYSTEPVVYSSFLFRSFDDGRTWEKTSQISQNCNETTVIKIKEAGLWSKWLAAARNSDTTLELYSSYNDAETWRFEKMVTERKQGPGHFLRLSDGRILLGYGNRRTGSCGVAARLSADEGVTWSNSIQIADMKTWDGGYPSSVELKDGRILTVYYAKQSSVYDNYHMISVVWSLPDHKTVNLSEVKLNIEPQVVRKGNIVTVNASCENSDDEVKYFITTPYTLDQREVLPGFKYDEQAKKCFLQDDSNEGIFKIKTDGWKPGLYYFSLVAKDQLHQTYRDFLIKVMEEKEVLKVKILKDEKAPWKLKEKALINFIKLDNKTILANPFSSSDGGWTWKKDRAVAGYTGCQLDNGKLVLLGGVRQNSKKDGLFNFIVHESLDNCKTINTSKRPLLVPNSIPGFAHAHYINPLLYRSVVHLPGGKMLATMYGRFDGDNTPWNWHGVQKAMKTRSFVVESVDFGMTWEYLSTIACDPEIGMEGFNETAMIRLNDGKLLAVVRTGDNAHTGWEDNQLYKVISNDDGKTWSKPIALGIEGVSPDLCLMQDGTIVCSYGRPGINIMFSLDNGDTWTGHTSIHSARYKCYTAICEGNENEIVLSYIVDILINDKGTKKRESRLAILSTKRLR